MELVGVVVAWASTKAKLSGRRAAARRKEEWRQRVAHAIGGGASAGHRWTRGQAPQPVSAIKVEEGWTTEPKEVMAWRKSVWAEQWREQRGDDNGVAEAIRHMRKAAAERLAEFQPLTPSQLAAAAAN